MKNSIIRNIIIGTCVFIFIMVAFPVQVNGFHIHIYRNNKTVLATCTTKGYIKLKCRCGATKQVTLSKTNHSYKTITEKATCIKNGYTKTYCINCKKVKTNKIIKATGHTIVIDKAVPAGYSTTGLTQGSHCIKCNKVIKKQEVIPATGNSVWNGKTFTKPTKTEGGYLLINSPNELAWVLKNKNTNNKTKIKLQCNIDMGNYTLPAFTNKVKEFNGNNKYIKNLKINGTGLFGDSNGLTVSNLTLDNVKITSSKNVGILVGTLKGNSTFKNCKVTNSSVVTSKGYAGGFVGYIVRSNKTDRSKSIAVTLNGCSIKNTTIKGTLAEGKFVGALNGYDNKETLTFTNCSADTKVHDFSSYYIAKNQSTFLKAINSKYNGFLGTEVYYRGIIKFDGNRFIPKWNGKTTITPLLADPKYDGSNVTKGKNKFVVYSPFDMAGIRKVTDSPAAIYLKENIDMNGQGADGKYNVPSNFTKSKYTSKDDNNFSPFKTVAVLDGNNKTIYNLSISQLKKETGAFILSASGTTVHKNIKFNNCQTTSTHKQVKTDAKAYGAILIANASGTSYTMENVTATNCKVFALQKVGTLAGRLGATNNYAKNCTVENCYIENYECKISETFDSGKKNIGSSRWVRVKADFYPHGEVGGMFGFVQNNATISNCHVKRTNIYGYGQNDKKASISGSTLGKIAIETMGYYLVPGRHVSTFIGDIRATGNVKITNCTVDSASKCTKRYDKHNSTYSYIGQAYYVKFLDPEGKTVTVNGNKLTIADCNENTKK